MKKKRMTADLHFSAKIKLKKMRVGLIPKIAAAIALAVFCLTPSFADIISLEQYLQLVEKNNPQLLALNANIEAAKNQIAQTERALTPLLLNAQGTYTDDKFTGAASGFKEIQTYLYNAAVTKQFITGTNVTLGGIYQNADSFADDAFKPLGIDNKTTVLLAPFVSVQQSLWKDFIFGGASRANLNAAAASAKANLYNLLYSKQNFILGAKIAYWSLALAKANTAYRKASLGRYQELLDWTSKKVRMDLADRPDLLQAQASQKSADLNYRLAMQSQNEARRAFNQFMNIDANSTQYDAADFNSVADKYNDAVSIKKTSTRYDVLASVENQKAAEYSQKAAVKNLGPDLVAGGKYTANGAGTDMTAAKDMDKPVWEVSATLSVPLDFARQSKVTKSYKAQTEAAKNSAAAALIAEQIDWTNLYDKLQMDMINLNMARQIRDLQEQYVAENRRLLQRGRTTTNLLIQSEEAFDGATLAVFNAMLTLITDYEKANLFYNNPQDFEEDK